MPHIAIREHRGHTVVQARFPRGTDLNGIRTILTDTAFVYAQIPQGSILSLVDFDDQILDEPKVHLIEAVAKANSEAVLATALVGVAGSQRALYQQLLELMHRNARIFDDEGPALDWLVSEAEGLAWLTEDPGPPGETPG